MEKLQQRATQIWRLGGLVRNGSIFDGEGDRQPKTSYNIGVLSSDKSWLPMKPKRPSTEASPSMWGLVMEGSADLGSLVLLTSA